MPRPARDLASIVEQIPPLPAVAMQVVRMVNDVEFSMSKLVDIVRTDPVLTTKILDHCNSSLFALAHEISSVGQALSYLGIRNIVKIVITTCTSSYFQSARSGIQYLHPKVIWRHSVASALVCQRLARNRDDLDEGTAFTAGILHNLGKVVIAQLCDESSDQSNFTAGPCGDPLLDAERHIFGTNHAHMASKVTERWKIPNDLKDAIRDHHDPTAIETGGILTAVLHIADLSCLSAGIGGSPQRNLEFAIEPAALRRLDVDDKDLQRIQSETLDELARSEELVNMV